jgi:hypothetical protein
VILLAAAMLAHATACGQCLEPPQITVVDPPSFQALGCFEAWSVLILGHDFCPCSSLILVSDHLVYELLPDPSKDDCGFARGGSESPRERMLRVLPPDGKTIDCSSRPDLVPFPHARICTPGSGPDGIELTPAPFPNGVLLWVNEGEQRLLYGPDVCPY